jgi:phage-related protein
MALGFTDLTSTQRVPDKGLNSSNTPRTFTVAFGDGYEQRVANGINALSQSFSVSFDTRPKEEIDDIIAFFVNKAGVTAFSFTYADSNNSGETTIKVVCDDWSQSWDYDDFYSASATFRKVYES